jgi:hypothetical protein
MYLSPVANDYSLHITDTGSIVLTCSDVRPQAVLTQRYTMLSLAPVTLLSAQNSAAANILLEV